MGTRAHLERPSMLCTLTLLDHSLFGSYELFKVHARIRLLALAFVHVLLSVALRCTFPTQMPHGMVRRRIVKDSRSFP